MAAKDLDVIADLVDRTLRVVAANVDARDGGEVKIGALELAHRDSQDAPVLGGRSLLGHPKHRVAHDPNARFRLVRVQFGADRTPYEVRMALTSKAYIRTR